MIADFFPPKESLPLTKCIQGQSLFKYFHISIPSQCLQSTTTYVCSWRTGLLSQALGIHQTPTSVLKIPVAPLRVVRLICGVLEKSVSWGTLSSFARTWTAALAPLPGEQEWDNVNLTITENPSTRSVLLNVSEHNHIRVLWKWVHYLFQLTSCLKRTCGWWHGFTKLIHHFRIWEKLSWMWKCYSNTC